MTDVFNSPLVGLDSGVINRTCDAAVPDASTLVQELPWRAPAIRPIRVAITSAGGPAASALMFQIAAGGVFGASQPVALSLLDRTEKRAVLEASTTALQGEFFPLVSSVKIGCDPRQVFAGADWVILLGGDLPPAETDRLDIVRVNAPAFTALGRAINDVAPWARVLVATSPCNTNCLVARSCAPDVPADQWFALTRLTQNRARALIAAEAGVPARMVSRLTVWGNDSEAAYGDIFNARIGELPAHRVPVDRAWERGSSRRPCQDATAPRRDSILPPRLRLWLMRCSPPSGRSRRPRRTAVGSVPRSCPMVVTGSREGWYSASRSAPRTAGLGRSSRV